MAIRFFFEYNNQVVQLPVNPEEIMINSSGNNTTSEIVKLGEINLLRQKKLERLAIECFLPMDANAPYVLTKGKFEKPQFYIDFFEKIRKEKKPFRFIISDTKINMLAAIEDLEYGLKAGDDDIHYSISLKEYRPFSSKVVKIKLPTNKAEPAKVTPPPKQERPKTGFSIGDTVIANGKYWYSSYGDKPFGTFNNFTGKISHIVANKSRKYRYHITTPSGGYRGWVDESQIKHK
jgi:hypothetical protein